MRKLPDIKRLVVKVGTSTLTYENGRLNLGRIQNLARVLSDVKNSGVDLVLVTSGAIGVGVETMGLGHRPESVAEKQAAAAVGQPQLMEIYEDSFGKYNTKVAQILLTKYLLTDTKMHANATATFEALLDADVLPIVNENDTVVTDEILFGDNDTLSAHIATLVQADLLLILTDIDGLYDKNPLENPDATLISSLPNVTEDVKVLAGGSSSNRGTGGMITKLEAAEIAQKAQVPTLIMNGTEPDLIYQALKGEELGTIIGA
ncbi:MAG: glutamate 5-kinase [Streptococcaceae bacterium]|jgi:glutamate 5-kinase|nr:glutamate 5-kinase [Streptococcaceae bacterium]